jgi:hypothetical protein
MNKSLLYIAQTGSPLPECYPPPMTSTQGWTLGRRGDKVIKYNKCDTSYICHVHIFVVPVIL